MRTAQQQMNALRDRLPVSSQGNDDDDEEDEEDDEADDMSMDGAPGLHVVHLPVCLPARLRVSRIVVASVVFVASLLGFDTVTSWTYTSRPLVQEKEDKEDPPLPISRPRLLLVLGTRRHRGLQQNEISAALYAQVITKGVISPLVRCWR